VVRGIVSESIPLGILYIYGFGLSLDILNLWLWLLLYIIDYWKTAVSQYTVYMNITLLETSCTVEAAILLYTSKVLRSIYLLLLLYR
jgi:hypothetical protein